MTKGRTRNVALNDIVVPPNRMRRLRPETVDALAESIRERGLLHPITAQPSQGRYELVAGVHRLKAVEKLGHEHIRTVVIEGLDADAAQLTEIDENLVRADLSPAERALHIARRKQLYEKLYPETRRGVAGGKARHGSASDKMSFAESTAKMTGKTTRTVQREVERAAKIPDLADVVGTTLDTTDELDKLAKLPQPVQRELIERARAGEKVTARHEAQKLRRESRERDLAEATEAASRKLGAKRYGVIYADPPWKFEVYAESGMTHCADAHYPCMPLESIKALPIPAADHAVLFLWSTPPMQSQAHEVMAAWGFTYKSLIVWDKGRDGTGYWVRGRVEILLIGTRSEVPAPSPGEQPPQLIAALRGRHSEKPAIFAEIIETLYPTTPKIELFARKARPGWDVWGNEAPIIADDLSIPDFLLRKERPEAAS